MKPKFAILPIALAALVTAGVSCFAQGYYPGPGMGVPPGFSGGPPMAYQGQPYAPAGYMPAAAYVAQGQPGGYYEPAALPADQAVTGMAVTGDGIAEDVGLECGDSGCPAPVRSWVSAEVLCWWTKGKHLPPLVTTSPDGTLQANAGVLPGATTVFGGGAVDDGARSGLRLTVGRWMDGNYDVSIFGRFLTLDNETVGFQQFSNGSPILARPFFDVNIPGQNADLIAYAGQVGDDIIIGSVDAHTVNEIIGAELLASVPIIRGWGHRLDLIGGYQFSRMNDGLSVSTHLISKDPAGVLPVDSTIDGFDSFRAANEFHGGVVGGQVEIQHGALVFQALGKVGLGNMHQSLAINGGLRTETPGGAVNNFVGNLLAQKTNIGAYEQDVFVAIPEVNLTVSYRLTERLEVSAGYTAMYWSRALLAGNQIDSSVNLTQLTGPLIGPARPQFLGFQTTDFWVQGFNVGLTGRF